VADNVTFPAILDLIREDLEIELARVLFEDRRRRVRLEGLSLGRPCGPDQDN
jgi:hypothetical protein